MPAPATPYCTLLLLLCCGGSFAQHDYAFEALTTREGLSENVVMSMYQDRKGLMWFGTYDGLNRYDGYGVRVYRHNPDDSLSLPGNVINTLMQDNAGRYWVGTNNGVGRLDAVSGAFAAVKVNNKVFNESIARIVELAPYEYLLISHNYKAFWYGEKSNTLVPLQCRFTSGKVADAEIHYVVVQIGDDFYTTLFERHKNVFAKWNKRAKRFDEVSLPGADVYARLFFNCRYHFVDTKGRLWLSFEDSSGYKTTVYHNRSTQPYQILPVHQPHEWMNSMAEDRYGNIWMSNSTTLYKWDEQVEQITPVKLDQQNNTICTQVFVDRAGLVWVATRGKGVMKYNPARRQFSHFTADNASNRLFKPFVFGLIPYQKNKLWVKHDFSDSILTGIDVRDHSMSYFDIKKIKDTLLLDKHFLDYLERNDLVSIRQLLWSDGIPYFWEYLSDTSRLKINTPRSLRILHALNGAASNSGRFFLDEKIRVDSLSILSAMLQGDTLWVGNDAFGLLAMELSKEKWTRYLFSPNNRHSLSGNNVKEVLFTPSGNLWIATDNGLNYLDKTTGRFHRYGVQEGLCHPAIYCMTYDRKGRIWMGTGNGLSCFDTATKQFFNFTQTDGLINTEYNRHSAYTSPEGWVYMGGTNGIDYFHPDHIQYSAAPLPVVFSDFSVYNQPLPVDSLPPLQHHQNYISVSFTLPDYTYPQGNTFLYKLDGVDKGWNVLQGSNTVRYANLAPGSYRLLVKAANYRGIWNSTPAALSFVVQPPWWRQWWFYGLSIAAIALTGFVWVKRFTRSKLAAQRILLEKKQAVEIERGRISAELHDDMGGELAAIRLISDMAQNGNLPDARQQFVKISTSSAELVQKLNEIVWALNVHNDTLQSLVGYIHRYAVKLLDDMDIRCTFMQPEKIPACTVEGSRRRHIFLLVKEALNNVIKHAGATEVLIKIEVENGLCMTVQDNGSGIASGKEPGGGGNGMLTMQKRVAELGGTLSILNGEGTTLHIYIPLGENDTKM